MIDKRLEMTAYEAQYRMPWIVFGRPLQNPGHAVVNLESYIKEKPVRSIQKQIWDYMKSFPEQEMRKKRSG